MICYSNPGSHPFISKDEREYLQSELGQLKRNDNLPPTPWKSILTSVPMIALVCAQVKWIAFSCIYNSFKIKRSNKWIHLIGCNLQIGHDWGFYIMVSDLPKYMSDVLKFTITDNGIYSSLPYLLMWVVSVTTGFLSDFLITRNCCTITGARKWFTGIGMHWEKKTSLTQPEK